MPFVIIQSLYVKVYNKVIAIAKLLFAFLLVSNLAHGIIYPLLGIR
jgi:hypothetical protein